MVISAILSCLLLICSRQNSPEATAVPDVGTDYQQTQSFMDLLELEGLFEVMEAIAGDTDWRTLHPHPCSDDVWPGLVCEQGEDGLLHVTRLDFGYKPNPLCMKNATIPPAIGKLSSLESLFIFDCFTVHNTTIPPELKDLAPSLKELSLRTNNALIGEIPPELGNLIGLQVLSLSQNSLEGSIPSNLGKLSSLEHLDLSYNKLHGELPNELGSLKNLVILDLSVNSLTGSVPRSFGGLSMLQKLDLSFNSLESTLPADLGDLRSLEFLAMSDNFITGPFPDTFSSLLGLQYLIMDNNPMNVTLPKFLGALGRLVVLSLSNSGYFGSIPDGMGRLSFLRVLSLDRNKFTGKIPVELTRLPHIYELNLSQNLLSGPVPFSPAFIQKMSRKLDLQGNSGLCSQWALPESSSAGYLRLCEGSEEEGYSSEVSSKEGSPLNALSRGLKNEQKTAIYTGVVSMACLQLLLFFL